MIYVLFFLGCVLSFFIGSEHGRLVVGQEVSRATLQLFSRDKSKFMAFYMILLENHPEPLKTKLLQRVSVAYDLSKVQ